MWGLFIFLRLELLKLPHRSLAVRLLFYMPGKRTRGTARTLLLWFVTQTRPLGPAPPLRVPEDVLPLLACRGRLRSLAYRALGTEAVPRCPGLLRDPVGRGLLQTGWASPKEIGGGTGKGKPRKSCYAHLRKPLALCPTSLLTFLSSSHLRSQTLFCPPVILNATRREQGRGTCKQ